MDELAYGRFITSMSKDVITKMLSGETGLLKTLTILTPHTNMRTGIVVLPDSNMPFHRESAWREGIENRHVIHVAGHQQYKKPVVCHKNCGFLSLSFLAESRHATHSTQTGCRHCPCHGTNTESVSVPEKPGTSITSRKKAGPV